MPKNPSPKLETSPKPAEEPWYRQPKARKAGMGILVAAVAGLLYWAVAVYPYVSTDDARVAATLVRVAPEGAGGKVVKLNVTEGDAVRTNDVLVELDPTTAQAQLERAESKATLARKELKRAEELAAQKGVSAKQVDEARAAASTADAEERLAQLALEHCTLRSPFNGMVVQKAAEVGNQIETGQTAVTVADLDNAWVAANVEETDVGKLKAGQPVKIEVDEGGTLSGHLLEVRDATLSTFSLIPSENASGNFVKLVQRVPLKVALDPHPDRVLRVGQSVEIRIRVH